MPLPTGQISMSQVNVELGLSATAQISLNDAAVRSLAGVPSGAISMQNLQGKSAAFAATISSNQQQLNLRTWAIANGWNGTSAAIITVGSGVYIWSDNTANPAMTVDGSWPGGLTIVNNGFIMGRGGDGQGYYYDPNAPTSAQGSTYLSTAGGPAISTTIPLTINNQSGYIGGGGGGGGSANSFATGGGGAGGGVGGRSTSIQSGYSYDSAGGAGGAVGSSGSSGDASYNTGGGGGRIMPGTRTSTVTFTTSSSNSPHIAGEGGQAGGGPGASSLYFKGAAAYSASGGGGWGSSGAGGTMTFGDPTVTITTGYGGAAGENGTGGNGSSSMDQTLGAAGGKAINTNGQAITWVGGTASSSRAYGAVS